MENFGTRNTFVITDEFALWWGIFAISASFIDVENPFFLTFLRRSSSKDPFFLSLYQISVERLYETHVVTREFALWWGTFAISLFFTDTQLSVAAAFINAVQCLASVLLLIGAKLVSEKVEDEEEEREHASDKFLYERGKVYC